MNLKEKLAFFVMMKYCFRLLLFLLSIVITSIDSIHVMLIKCYLLFCYYTLFINCEYYYRGGFFRVVVSYWARRSLAFPLPWRFVPGTEETEGNIGALQGDIQPWLAWRVPKFYELFSKFSSFLFIFVLFLCTKAKL